MAKTNWGGGKQTPGVVRGIEALAQVIDNGTVLAIDPASRSMGYSLYKNGKVVSKGKIVSRKKAVNDRLVDIYQQLKSKFKSVDILAVEKIRGSTAHDFLKWSVGVAIVAIQAEFLVEVPIPFWKKLIAQGYVKDDDNDAELIGMVLVRIAAEAITSSPKKYKRRKR